MGRSNTRQACVCPRSRKVSLCLAKGLVVPGCTLALLLCFASFALGKAANNTAQAELTATTPGGETISSLHSAASRSLQAEGIDLSRITQVSTHPRVFVFKSLLSPDECDRLIDMSVETMPAAADEKLEPHSSVGTFLRKYQDEFVRSIEDRITSWLWLPRDDPFSLQVLRYNEGQKYDTHYDYFEDNENTQRTGGRVATFVAFLNNIEQGGEIVFPKSEHLDPQPKEDPSWTDCGRKSLAVKPQKGDALLFFHMDVEGYDDPKAEMKECPVLRGQKWQAKKFVHVQKYMKKRNPNICEDDHPKCAEWAKWGECTKNPAYMVGEKGSLGACRKSCKVCENAKKATAKQETKFSDG